MSETDLDILFTQRVIPVFRHRLEPLGFTYLPRQTPAATEIHHDFYQPAGTIGKLLVLRTLVDPAEEELHFSASLGLFSSDFWAIDQKGRPEPVYPTMHNCLIQTWLARLMGRLNFRFTINQTTVMANLTGQLNDVLTTVILPYFRSKTTVDDLLNEMPQSINTPIIARMRLLHQLGRQAEARQELQRLIASRHQTNFRKMVVQIAHSDGLLP